MAQCPVRGYFLYCGINCCRFAIKNKVRIKFLLTSKSESSLVWIICSVTTLARNYLTAVGFLLNKIALPQM